MRKDAVTRFMACNERDQALRMDGTRRATDLTISERRVAPRVRCQYSPHGVDALHVLIRGILR